MCEVCTAEGENYLFKNGPRSNLIAGKLYKVFRDAVAPIKLCYIHSLELFSLGERRFLREHLTYARGLAGKSKEQVRSTVESPFGL
jgi:hypothetical protein